MYPHDLPEGIVAQQYAPDVVASRAYYNPTTHGMEARFAERYSRIRAILHGDRDAPDTPGSEAAEGEREPAARYEREDGQ